MIDPERYIVVHEGKEMSLPKKNSLSLLASQMVRVFSRENTSLSVWERMSLLEIVRLMSTFGSFEKNWVNITSKRSKA